MLDAGKYYFTMANPAIADKHSLNEGLIGISLQQNELSTADRDYVPSKDTVVWYIYMGFLPLARVRSSGEP